MSKQLSLFKTCSRCKQTKPIGEFTKDRQKKDGLRPDCIECERKDYQANIEKRRATKRNTYHKSPEHYCAYNHKYNKDNPEKRRAAKERNYRKHHAHYLAYKQEYYESRKAHLLELSTEWQRNNPDKVRSRSERRRARKLGTGGSFSESEWRILCEKHNFKCACCHSEKQLVADHVIPVSRGGTSNIDNIQPLCRSCNSKKGTKTTDYR